MKKIIVNLAFITLVTAGITSCKKLADMNVRPNNPSVENATPQLLFPSGVMASAGHIGGELAITAGLWSQYYTQSALANQYRTLDAYNLTTSDHNTAFIDLYRSALTDYKLTMELAEKAGDWRYYLMATCMKAYTYQVLADLFDKVPYSEALKGVENLQPKYDDGYDIYKGLLAEIDKALAKDYRSLPAFNADEAASDLVFQGSIDNWERFANTLKLKMYLRMVNAKATEAETGIKDLYTKGAKFLATGAGITTFSTTVNAHNPFYEQNIERLNVGTNLRASVTFVSWLQANSDPRIVSYFGSNNPGAIHQGDYESTNPAYGSAAVFVQSKTDPVWFISEAESYFMQAEAKERYYAGAGAKELYEAGVTAAFAQLALTPGSLLSGAYKYPAAGTLDQKLEAIIMQKWASFPGTHDVEGFLEQSRTGIPKVSSVYSTSGSYVPGQLVYSKNGVTGGQLPKRFIWVRDERRRNPNVPVEVPVSTKVWWAK